MSRLIETMRIEQGTLAQPEYHAARIRSSSMAVFNRLPEWDVDRTLASATSGVGSIDRFATGHTLSKCRLIYDAREFQLSVEPYTIRPIASLKVVMSNDIMYHHKFADRRAIHRLFEQRGDCDDVLIVKNGTITDVSYANIVFRKGAKWYTPDTFLLNGTMRQWLLDTQQISEATITVNDLSAYSHFKLINAMLRFDAPAMDVSNIR